MGGVWWKGKQALWVVKWVQLRMMFARALKYVLATFKQQSNEQAVNMFKTLSVWIMLVTRAI